MKLTIVKEEDADFMFRHLFHFIHSNDLFNSIFMVELCPLMAFQATNETHELFLLVISSLE